MTMIDKLNVKFIQGKIAEGKPRKFADGGGLSLVINKSGSIHWRLSYRFDDKQKTLTLGSYPKMTLAQARNKRNDIKADIRKGKDPIKKKKEKILFKNVAKDWYNTNADDWTPKHAHNVWKSLEDNIFNHIGNKAIDKIEALELIEILKIIESRGALEQLKKVRVRCNHIFIFAKVHGFIKSNPCEGIETVLKSPTPKNYNSIQLKDLPELVKDINTFDGEPTTKAGLEIALHTFLRTNEIRFLKWDNINFDEKLIIIDKEFMKMKREHIVPMSNKVINTLKDLQAITGQFDYIFASSHKPQKPFSENAMLYALYRLGWHGRMTVHGFRHLASTTLRELGYASHVVEKQLSHESKNKIEATYNKAEYLADRIKMMNDWSTFIENANGKIIPINSKQSKK